MLKTIIVDDELLMRIGLRSMIQWEAHGFQIVGEAAHGREALEIASRVQPDLIITDVRMPIMDGIALVREASLLLKGCKYVILSNFDEFRYVKEAMQLGASDYLIKCEMKTDTLIQLLHRIRGEIVQPYQNRHSMQLPDIDLKQSISYLKESLFKEVISGLKTGEELTAKNEQLRIRLRPQPLFLIKLKIEQFEELKRKYVEQDEQLLRFSIVNVLEEVVPNRWMKEIIVESSSEYLVILNVASSSTVASRDEIGKLCSKMMQSLKDFMNVQVSAGVSTVVDGFRYIRLAFQEATLALQQRFYVGAGHVLFFEENRRLSGRVNQGLMLSRRQARECQSLMESRNGSRLRQFLHELRQSLLEEQASAEEVRGIYISLIELANSHALRPRDPADDRALYDTLLKEGTWPDIHVLVEDYMVGMIDLRNRENEQQTYGSMAIRIIDRSYSSDISLQSVARQINVNPSYLSRIFKQEMGMNFVSYLIDIRISQAKALLENKQLKVYEVAERVGYHNYSYFSRIFKKVVGVSPEEYRG